MRAALAALAFASLAGAVARGWEWRETTTPHFLIHHQAPWLPPGVSMGLEKIHSRLRMDLGQFSPWMAKERISLYVYKDLEAYVAGEFHPPPWSNGVAVYGRKAVAVAATKEPKQLLRVLAHETTHLLFVGYFRESRAMPPNWLNEGLAMVEEADSPDRPETSQWYQAMTQKPAAAWFPVGRFLEIAPAKDLHDDKAEVADWYVQAYSMTLFLVRKHSRLQFKSFCARLRDGKTVPEALWLVYRYRTSEDFDKRWRLWLADPSHKRRVASLAASQRAAGDGTIEKAGRGNSSFQDFSTGRFERRGRAKTGD
jgi:hypothetical protein